MSDKAGTYIVLIATTLLNFSVLALFGLGAAIITLGICFALFLVWAIYSSNKASPEVHKELSDVDDELNGLLIPTNVVRMWLESDMTKEEILKEMKK